MKNEVNLHRGKDKRSKEMDEVITMAMRWEKGGKKQQTETTETTETTKTTETPRREL